MNNMTGLIYMSSPYSDKDPAVVKKRFDLTVKALALLINKGCFVISPIVHGHPMIEAHHDIPGDWKFWKNYCESILCKCGKLFILQIPGWEISTGVKGEIYFALENNIQIYLLRFNEDYSDLTIELYTQPSKLAKFIGGYTKYDAPLPGSLHFVKGWVGHHNEVTVGNTDFLAYSKVRVPFIKHGELYFVDDGSDIVPSDKSGIYSSCRRYIANREITDADFDTVNNYLVYDLNK